MLVQAIVRPTDPQHYCGYNPLQMSKSVNVFTVHIIRVS